MDENPYRAPQRRRWFRFRLRTLLLVVTAVSVWLGWNYRIVHERREVLKMVREKDGSIGAPILGQPSQLSWIRQALGDEEVYGHIGFVKVDILSAEEEARIRAAFPEAEVVALRLRD